MNFLRFLRDYAVNMSETVKDGYIWFVKKTQALFIDVGNERIRINPPADWNEKNTEKPSYIANKPQLGTVASHNIAQKVNNTDDIPTSSMVNQAISNLRSLVGSPLTAIRKVYMTDPKKVYVYTGDEEDMHYGHWYYYDGTVWQDGGIYNSMALETDTSLSLAGEAADAEAVGDALFDHEMRIIAIEESDQMDVTYEIANMQADIDDLQTGVNNISTSIDGISDRLDDAESAIGTLQDQINEISSFNISIVSNLPSNPEYNTFYLIPISGNKYEKWWYIKNQQGVGQWDKFEAASSGGSSLASYTYVVSSLPQNPDIDGDYILAQNGEYFYYKYINNQWVLISGGGSSEASVSEVVEYPTGVNVSFVGNGEPVVDAVTNNEKYYLRIDTMTLYRSNGTTWTISNVLVNNPDENKDYYIQGANEEWIHIKYIDNSFVGISTNTQGQRISIGQIYTEDGQFGAEWSSFKQNTNSALDELSSGVNDINSKKMYRVSIESNNGNIFKNGDINCVLSCRVFSWDDEITDEINAANFTWTRKSKNADDDTRWNTNHSGGTKSITVTPSDVWGRSVFYCSVVLPDGSTAIGS